MTAPLPVRKDHISRPKSAMLVVEDERTSVLSVMRFS